jgi:hypothetical protein
MGKLNMLLAEHVRAFLQCFRCTCATRVLLVLLVWVVAPLSAQEPPPSSPLKNAVILMGANSANDALSTPVQSGSLALDLYLQVEKALKDVQQGKLTVTKFLAQTPPAEVVATTIRIAGGSSSTGDEALLEVPLTAPDLLHVKLAGGALRPGTTYRDGCSSRPEVRPIVGN